jgi:hypothetical protein
MVVQLMVAFIVPRLSHFARMRNKSVFMPLFESELCIHLSLQNIKCICWRRAKMQKKRQTNLIRDNTKTAATREIAL